MPPFGTRQFSILCAYRQILAITKKILTGPLSELLELSGWVLSPWVCVSVLRSQIPLEYGNTITSLVWLWLRLTSLSGNLKTSSQTQADCAGAHECCLRTATFCGKLEALVFKKKEEAYCHLLHNHAMAMMLAKSLLLYATPVFRLSEEEVRQRASSGL